MKKKNSWLVHPITHTVITVAVIIIGLMPSFYSAEIGSPLKSIPQEYRSFIAPVFWGALIILCPLFFFTRRAEKNDMDSEKDILHKKHEKLNEQSEKLADLIRTMPPAGFLKKYAHVCSECFNIFNTSAEVQNRDIINSSIRSLLNGVLTLIDVFEKNITRNTLYGANLMTFGNIPADQENIIFFDTGIENLEGVLVLDTELSTNTKNTEPKPDDTIRKFYLPIPKKKQTEKGKHKVLAGAPYSYVSKNPILFPKIGELVSWLDEKGDFTQALKDEIRTYFLNEERKEIQSFVSIPIKHQESEDIIAILNIHKNTENILHADAAKLDEFVDMITPITIMISVLLKKRESL